MPQFELVSPYSPDGDQPRAIDELVAGLHEGRRHQTLLGGTGSPDLYSQMAVVVEKNQAIDRTALLRRLSENHYQRNELDFARGKFRVRGDAIEVFPAYEETAIRIELDFDTVAEIQEIHPL